MEHREAELDWDGGWQAGLDGDELSELFLRGATTLPRGQLVGMRHHFGVLAGSEETQRYETRRAAADRADETGVGASGEAASGSPESGLHPGRAEGGARAA